MILKFFPELCFSGLQQSCVVILSSQTLKIQILKLWSCRSSDLNGDLVKIKYLDKYIAVILRHSCTSIFMTKGYAMLFRPEATVASFLHVMVLVFKVFINYLADNHLIC